uniref:Putative No apical meristem-associated C-terminal domain n=1 Tax=Davidia involucrata TaxID=16924 RepID=A0A5B7C6A8_DAVIN
MRRKKNIDAVNLFVKEFSNLRKEQKEIAEKEILMAHERERLRIQAKQEQERLRLKAKLKQRRMKIAVKREQEQKRLEKEIMITDPKLIPTEEGKAWIIAQQKAIWARAMQGGVGDGSSGSGV